MNKIEDIEAFLDLSDNDLEKFKKSIGIFLERQELERSLGTAKETFFKGGPRDGTKLTTHGWSNGIPSKSSMFMIDPDIRAWRTGEKIPKSEYRWDINEELWIFTGRRKISPSNEAN